MDPETGSPPSPIARRGPGLFDLQVNGYAGVDFNDPGITPAQLDAALNAMLRAGVTGCLPTIITAPVDVMTQRLRALDRAVAESRLGPVMVPGYHLEGPFLNPRDGYAGCHPAGAMIPPDHAVVELMAGFLLRPVLLLTLAPERPGSGAFIRQARASGRVVAIGHSAATLTDIARAAGDGATLSTHLGNALPEPQPKFDNPLMAQLAEDRLSASFIADGIHVPPHALKVMIRAKTIERSILVTDATAAAAAPGPGLHRFAGMTIELTEDGAVSVPGTTRLAGSALTLDQAVRNIVAWGIAEPDDALRMAADNPRALLAPALAAHGIQPPPGEVAWSEALRPIRVRVGSLDIVP